MPPKKRTFKYRHCRVEFEPRDLWVGIYWTFEKLAVVKDSDMRSFCIYLCIIPCLPIIFTWTNSHIQNHA